uniref:Transmembrane protein 144-like n=1 Tax=Sinocyclocheilus rhinocerous TaxID=307959 RepID=A0A673G9D2_9TELE
LKSVSYDLLLSLRCFVNTGPGLQQTTCHNNKCSPLSSNETNSIDTTYGFVACVISVLLYGSYFIPVKTIDTSDGEFNLYPPNQHLNNYKKHKLKCYLKQIYLSGNITAVPVVKFIGLGLGILLWGSSGLLIGWFGWFGLHPEEVSKPILNYCGAGLCLLSAIIFFFVKSDVQKRTSTESMPLLIDDRIKSMEYVFSMISSCYSGCILAIFSGVLYGSSFVPALYYMFTGSSQNEIDYCFAHYSGIFLKSTVYFLAYCAVMKNRPRIYPRAILPGFLSGLMWGLATYVWLMANYYLSAVITFPIINAGFGLVAALWGSVVFKEVKGLGNLLLFALASCVVLAGSLLTACSKI